MNFIVGALSNSRFMNIGVETQVTWPKEPTRVSFAGHRFVLFPKTKEYTHSISVDLTNERLSDDGAITLINRFLSLLSWCCDQHAVLGDGWSGNPVPVPVPRPDPAFATAYEWHFYRSVSDNDELLQRLAYYREGLNAREAGLTTFSVLSFFKVFEVRQASRRGEPNPTKLWIAEAFDSACEGISREVISRFFEYKGKESVEDYLHGNCRTAIAHASENYRSDADASTELHRLVIAADIIQALARYYIRSNFKLGESYISEEIIS
jgi:hypothetical protein